MSISTMSEAERAWRSFEFGDWCNTGLNGQLKGYVCEGPIRFEKRWWLIPAVGIYDFRLNDHHPLTFICGKRAAKVLGVPVGTMVQCSKRYETDKGSVPIRLQKFYRTDRFTGFYPHDSAYEFGYLWVKRPDEAEWTRLFVIRWQADALLGIMVGAQDGNALDRAVIFNAVWLAGWTVWSPQKKAAIRVARRTGK